MGHGLFWVGMSALLTGQSFSLWEEARPMKAFKETSPLAQVAQKALPSVLALATRTFEEKEQANEATEPSESSGYGTAFVIHPDGYLLTSSHVVEGAAEILAQVPNALGPPRECVAKIIGLDAETDVALLKIDVPYPLPVLKLATARGAHVADWVVVIGNPFGLAQSVSVGVISHVERTNVIPQGRSGYFDYLQTDASINPGNSGGPILNFRGEVIAIANAVNVSGQGIGFATPIDIAKTVIPQLWRYGKVHRGWLGVDVRDLTAQEVQLFQSFKALGVLVSHVEPGSPAEEAGLSPGDVIRRLDERPTRFAHVFRWQLSVKDVGTEVQLEVLREGRTRHFHVRLGNTPKAEN